MLLGILHFKYTQSRGTIGKNTLPPSMFEVAQWRYRKMLHFNAELKSKGRNRLWRVLLIITPCFECMQMSCSTGHNNKYSSFKCKSLFLQITLDMFLFCFFFFLHQPETASLCIGARGEKPACSLPFHLASAACRQLMLNLVSPSSIR